MFKLNRLAAACAVLLAVPAFAQTDTETSDAAALDRVTVTGTNIKGVDMQDSQPVVVFDAEAIRETGATTITELLQELNQTGGGTGNFTTSNSGARQADSPAGFAGVSLRGLGTASTLTLVNGRRIAVASFANGSENFVDINSIPLSAVDRVEILTTGASAIYGADAVAGVVNFILRNDFDGFQVRASAADSHASTDEGRYNANLVWGRSGDKGHGLVIFDVYKRNALYDRDRAISAVEPRPSQQGIFPSFNDLFAQDIDFVERTCPDSQRYDGRPGFPNSRFGEYCELNRNFFTATIPETTRVGLMASGGYRVNGVELFSELSLQHNTSRADSDPAPWSNEEILFNHPNMPGELRQRLLAADVDPDFPIFGWGRFPDARTIEVETRSWRWVGGATGQLGEWNWESALNLSRSRSTQEAIAGIYNVERFRAALLGELCASGDTNCTPGTGGLFYDPFNGQTGNSEQLLSLVRERVPRDGDSRLYAWDAKVSGLWGSMPAGPIAWAYGIETRREDIRDQPSPLATADPLTGEVPVYGFGSTAVRAERRQWALYGEALLPLHDTLDLRLAARHDYYNDFGSDFNPAASFRWQPLERVVVRGGWNSAFRAPSLAQVGAGVTLSSGALPCSPGSEFFDTFCDGFAGDDFYLSEIYGNPDLKPETSKAWYLGTAFALSERSTLSFDWWNFNHRNLVDIDALELFRLALANPSLVVREGELAAGQIGIATRNGSIGSPIEQVNLELINVGQQKTSGLDVSLDQRFDLNNGAELRFYVDATWTHTFKRQESCSNDGVDVRRGAGACIDGQRLVERVGEFRYPEWLVNTGVTWRQGDWTARTWANYTHGYFDDDQRDGVPAGRKVSSWTIFNLSLIWDITRDADVSFTIRNLTDRTPPLALGSAANVDLFNHNTLGRWYTLGYTHRF